MLTAHLKSHSYNEKLLKLRGFCKNHEGKSQQCLMCQRWLLCMFNYHYINIKMKVLNMEPKATTAGYHDTEIVCCGV
jgi:hypothetical protein